MVFSSATFVFLFLPVVYLVTRLLPFAWQNRFLVFASLVFYAWGEPLYIFVMLLASIVNYFLALHMTTRTRLALAVTFNIGMLAVFKYGGFFIENVNALLGSRIPVPDLMLPIGISFYTFQTLSYVIDVYRKRTEAQKNYFNLLLYIAFFPQLIAGPIVVYKDIETQIENRRMTVDNLADGAARFVAGLAKKLLVANTAAVIVDDLYAQASFGTAAAWLVMFAYMLQIYFDFSGYSDMAIGLGAMFGFHFKENFNYPYTAGSMQSFWRRWHISLSSWFRDYVYIPLGGNRKGKMRTVLNRFIVFFLTGLWHGAAWTFVIWGLFHGLFLLLESFVLHVERWPRLLRHAYTLLTVGVGFVIFRAETLAQSMAVFKGLVDFSALTVANQAALQGFFTPWSILLLLAGIAGSGPLLKRLRAPLAVRLAGSTALWLLCVLSLATATYNPFIYFRF